MKQLNQFIQEKFVINKDTQWQKKDLENPKLWKEGDILSGKFHYSVTIPCFYKIVKKTPAGFSLIELSKKVVKGHYNGDFYEVPDDSKLESDMKQKPKSVRIRQGNNVVVGSVHLKLWDGEPLWGNDLD